MTIHTKLIVFMTTMCVILLAVSVGIGTWTINTIVYKLNTDLLSLKLDAKIDDIEEVVELLELTGATAIDKYVCQAKAEMLQRLQESLSAEDEQYYIMAAKEGRPLLQVGGGQDVSIKADVFARMLNTRFGTTNIRDKEKTYFTVYRYVEAWDWLVGVSLPKATMFQQRQVYLMTVGFFSALTFVGLFLLAYSIGKRLIVNPIARLVDVTKKITAGHFEQSIRLPQRDEIGDLADAIRTMAQQLHQNFTQIDAQFATIQSDMAERTRAEEKIRQLRNYLSNIINSMPSVLVGVDREGRVTQWNRQAEQVTGLLSDQVAGKPLTTVFVQLTDQMNDIKTAIQERRVISSPKIPRQVEQETRYEDTTIFPLVANGVEGAVIRVDDVTEKVRMEEMMIQSEKMLTVGGLAAGMAHEINNPLAGMLQTAGVMGNRLTTRLNIPANRKAAEAAGTTLDAIERFMEARGIFEMLKTISASGMRVADVVHNMLSFARKEDENISPHYLNKIIDKTLELAATDYDLKKQYDFKQIEIVKAYAENMPAVPCQESKIQQVLLNIFSNGAQAMAASMTKNPRFRIRTYVDSTLYMACMEIEDNGPGMDETTRKQIFTPFFTTKPKGVGTGLGLSVSYFIITENHKGEMAVESRPDAGAKFVIRLPMK